MDLMRIDLYTRIVLLEKTPKHASNISTTTHMGEQCGVLEFEDGMMHECEKKQKKKLKGKKQGESVKE